MDLRLTFNEGPKEYDRLRPHYPANLSAEVIRFSALDKTGKALEIGIGTGQATTPFLQTGCELTAIEIGDRLAQYSREKFAEYERFNVINQDFESVILKENSYALVYSASAFHWIPPEIGIPKVRRLLKPGGVFAWFCVQPGPTRKPLHNELQRIYMEYDHYFKVGVLPFDRVEKNREILARRAALFEQHGFIDIEEKLFCGTRSLSARDYATLCSTHSDHRAIPEPDRTQLLQKIEDAVERCGGVFTFADTFILCMGKNT